MVSNYSMIHIVRLIVEEEFWGEVDYPLLIILQGEGNRQWLEGHYPSISKFKKTCGKKTVIPEKPDDENMILDACLVFLPELFSKIEHYASLKEIVRTNDFIDLDLNKPKQWDIIRREGLEQMGKISIESLKI
ncbi:MAG: hypothetical protein QXS21_06805 [Thermoproteota archaeon]